MEPMVFAGKYRVQRELGEAAAGRTYLASGPGDSRVVVKVVHPANAAAASEVEHDVSLISGIRHPALPTIFEWGHDGSDFFVVREYVPGADLELELGQQGRFIPLTAARYAAVAADALAQIHRRGLVHGNVKSANLIRTPEDEIKLVGGSLGLPPSATLPPDAPAADAYYLAPEQAEGGAPSSPATDVYAMGIVLYELIAGHVPFDGPNAPAVLDKQAHDAPTPLKEASPEIPAALDAVIMKALEKSPEARYADGEALRVALHDVLQPPAAAAGGPMPPRKRRAWPWVLAAVIVVAAALGLAWALGLFSGNEVTVPGVVGMTQTQASAAITAAGLQVGNVTFSGQTVAGIADGSVASQSPAKGAKVDPATKVDLVLGGAEKAKVPGVIGQTETQATIQLQNAGLVVGTVTKVSTSGVVPDMVVGQTPAAGLSVAKGSAVDLQISQNSGTVPNVTGVARSDAESALEAAGFVAAVTLRSSSSVPTGRVIEQNPTGGVTALTGSTVNIVVSSGVGTIVVPDVGGMTQAQAVNALTAAGFKAHVILQTGGGTVGTVVDQSPNAGTRHSSGSTVDITVVQ